MDKMEKGLFILAAVKCLDAKAVGRRDVSQLG